LRFNKPIRPDGSSMSFEDRPIAGRQSEREDGRYDDSLLAIDLLKIDNRSRMTLTKEVKDILPLKPGDTIAVYKDRVNRDLVLRVQRGSVLVDVLRITKEGAHTYRKKTETQKDSSNLLDKINDLSVPHYYSNDPHKRYFPNIVLIDDDPDILVTFQSYLSTEGFNVQVFSNSDEALRYLMSHSSEYKVVITDIRMPDVNGLEMYRKIKSVNANLKIMFVTALDAADELLSIFSDVKKDDIIRKPIERDQFVKRVKNAIFSCLSFFTFLISGLNSGSTSEVLSQYIAML
jgi:CheY-like chemotaxis protein